MEKPTPKGPEADTLALRYDALTRQLERMRGMQAAYFGRFFWWVVLTLAGLVALMLSGLFWGKALLPFLVVSAGVQASFYLYYVDFARAFARSLEGKLNRLLGEETLIAARLEDAYFYPLDAAKFSGYSLGRPWGFFSVYTLHWCGVWALFYAYGVYYMILTLYDDFQLGALGNDGVFVYTSYFLVLALWTFGNVAYLAWYFHRQPELAAMKKLLREAYGEPGAGKAADAEPSSKLSKSATKPTGASSS
ncbi:MAG: hypothetical protein AAGK14_13820 [Verrucomicrobiota bacterium]